MTETVFYTDSTAPAAYTGDLKRGIAGNTTGDVDKVQYALYEDTATWDAWSSWAEQNAYSSAGYTDYSSRALRMVGNWPTMQANTATDPDPSTATKSFMCITASGKGGVCMEGEIGASTNTVKTYYIPSADIVAKLETP